MTKKKRQNIDVTHLTHHGMESYEKQIKCKKRKYRVNLTVNEKNCIFWELKEEKKNGTE